MEHGKQSVQVAETEAAPNGIIGDCPIDCFHNEHLVALVPCGHTHVPRSRDSHEKFEAGNTWLPWQSTLSQRSGWDPTIEFPLIKAFDCYPSIGGWQHQVGTGSVVAALVGSAGAQ